MRGSACAIRLVMLAVACLASTAGAQQRAMSCIAVDRSTMWPTSYGASSEPDAVPRGAALDSLLTGDFDLIVITTEGVERATAERRRIRIVRMDSSARAERSGGIRDRELFAGTRLDLPAPTPDDSLRRARLLHDTDLELGIDRSSGRARWATAPGGLDSGEIYWISEVDRVGFRGRWVTGTFGMAIVRRGTLTVGEQERGYYCANRVR